MSYFKCDNKYQVILVLIFFILYFVCVLGNVSSVEFMGVDEHSIIDSINGLTSHSYYNMNANYHSQYYGWTYFSLNFFIVGFAKIVGVSEPVAINIIVRTTHFIIGLFCALSMLFLSRKIFDSFLIAFIITVAFITNPMLSHFLNEIHPESLGLFLQIVSILLFIDIYQSKSIGGNKFILAIIFLSLSSLCKQAFIISNFFVGLTFLILYFISIYEVEREIRYFEVRKSIIKAFITFFVVFFIVHPFAFIQPEKFLSAQAYIGAEHSSKAFSDVFPLWMDVLSNNPIVVLNALLVFFVPFIFKKHSVLAFSLIFSNLVSAIYIYKARLWITDTYLLPVFLFSFLNVAYFFSEFIFDKLSKTFNLIKVVILVIILLILGNNMAFSVYKQQSRYFKEELRTKNLSWNFLDKVNQDIKVAYSPNVAMPDKLKKTGCHAWQGCNDIDSLTKYSPDLVVMSPDYPHYNRSDYERFVRENGYNLVEVFDKEPIKRTVCSIPNYNEQRLYILSVLDIFNSTINCVNAYLEMLDDYKNNRVIDGEKILIYAKPE
ncbi:TPA: DUF6541 family protein [Vibrio cholerae]|uniref:DUF6541 family protein n=1 Tax=Vibrio cholerae TaxID=666 RepID=UPI0011D77A08|nr:DUF6541 family protein [Vibrio cholerae]EGR2427791.1 hypothetical protein [Vibrio cholerae]EGR3978657.1 hypothetical protein [Vibrio cholerae]EKF9699401.1 hypothetical protein [Vibrio cholerae]ELB7341663.1 hypothetical protein [Vibrio cholerae]ELC9567259.1 hypothetical protein [Vibrio cholerae]